MTRILTTLVALILSVFAFELSYVLIIVAEWRSGGSADPLWVLFVGAIFLLSQWAIWRSWKSGQATRGYRD